jgi:hypothetical protein
MASDRRLDAMTLRGAEGPDGSPGKAEAEQERIAYLEKKIQTKDEVL